jgi:hypothetical protein
MLSSPLPNNINYSAPLQKPSVIINSTQNPNIDLRQSKPSLVLPPWDTWHRPSWLLTVTDPRLTRDGKLASFYNVN